MQSAGNNVVSSNGAVAVWNIIVSHAKVRAEKARSGTTRHCVKLIVAKVSEVVCNGEWSAHGLVGLRRFSHASRWNGVSKMRALVEAFRLCPSRTRAIKERNT